MSYGCFTNRKIQEPRNSWAVTEKTNDKDSSVVLAVDRMLWNPVSKKHTMDLLAQLKTFQKLTTYPVQKRKSAKQQRTALHRAP